MKLKTFVILTFALIPFAAMFDAFIIEETNFIGYLYICLVEWTIYAIGIWTGKKWSDKEKSRIISNNQSKSTQEETQK